MRIRCWMWLLSVVVLNFLVAAAYAVTPQVNSTVPVSGPTGSQVQINGTGFGTVQGTVKFNGSYTATIVSWSDTQIVAVVPPQAFTGALLVMAGGVNSNQTVYFNVPGPQISTLSPASGSIGASVTITGSGFQATKGGNSSVTFNGFTATTTSWTDTQIVATVPANATTGTVKVSVNAVNSNVDKTFSLPNPVVASLVPSSGPVGTVVQVNGTGFGSSQGSSTLQFKGSSSNINGTITSWSDTSITATVPAAAVSGNVIVSVDGVVTNSNVQFTVPPPQVNSITPSSGVSGTQITVSGSGFQATKGTGSSLMINGSTATTTSWSDTQIVATVPSSTSTGAVRVTVNSNVSSNLDVLFTVPNPVVTSVSPGSGFVNTQITVKGVGFGSAQGSSTVKIGGTALTVSSWSDTQIVGTIPTSAQTGYITVTVSGNNSPSTSYWTIYPPQVASVSPSSGAPGSQVTVSGSGFRPTQTAGGSSSLLYFNGQSAAVTSWSETQIVATVPASATTGPVTVSGFNLNSNADVVFMTPNPVIATVTPTSGPVGTQVQINGTGFGSAAGTVKFANVAASVVSWSDSQIVATVPTASRSGAVIVTASGVTSNGNINFTVPPPQITSITPSSGAAGTQVTVAGSGFQPSKGSNSISFTTGSAWSVTSWSDTQIVATVPAAWGANAVKVTVNSGDSNNDLVFTEPSPSIAGIAPLGGPVGTQVQISGGGFGNTAGAVSFNFTNASIVSWSDTLITATVPTGAITGGVRVTAQGVTSPSIPTFVVSNLFVNALAPAGGPVGTQVTLTGMGFGASQGTSTVKFNSTVATVSSWSDTQIVANVPTGATTGPVAVTVNGVSNSNPTFTVAGNVVSGVTPTSGLPGSQVQISGSGFGATQGSSTVVFGIWGATVNSWSNTLITATVPSSATTGPVKVVVGGVVSNTTVNFNVIPTLITGVSPSSGAPGTQVTITGSGFGATQGTSTFSFNGTNASIVNWSDTSLTVTVPATATSGRVYAIVGGAFSNMTLNFTIPDPRITSITPASGVVSTQVTINGSGFRASQGSNSVRFNGNTASIVSWSDTQIVATVPAAAKTGPVTIAGSITSNQDVVFSMPMPVVSSLLPTAGPMDTQVQISGSGFGATQGSSTVKFNTVAANVVSWSDTVITARVPSTATSGVIAVTVGGITSPSTISFAVPPPHVVSVSPSAGTAGTQITITGTGFHATQGPGSVVFNNLVPATIVSWSDTQIVATVPSTASGPAMAVWQNQYSNWDPGFGLVNPRVTGLVPANGAVGTQIQINGGGFGATQGSSTVGFFASASTSIVSWSDTQIVAAVPADAQSGPLTVRVAGVSSNNTVNFTVPAPHITSISPSSGTVGTTLTINGSGFESIKGNSYVFFNGSYTTSAISWSDTQIVVAVPANALSGAVYVEANNGQLSNRDIAFTMPNPIVAGVTPASGPTGTQVQVNGYGFGATQGSSTVTFGNLNNVASVVSWSDTQIVAVVPAVSTSGPVQVITGGVTSNAGIAFNVPAPALTSITPSVGGGGNSVTITGTGFQPVQGGSGSYVYFYNGGSAVIKSWSATQIVAVVPPGTVTGSVNVSVNGIPGNYLDYAVPSHSISSLTPSSGPVGTQVTIAGTAFGASQGTNTLSFNSQTATVSSWSNTQIVATVPVTSATGPAVVAINGANSNADKVFTVPPPTVSNFQPNGGNPNTTVTINGSGFQANQRDSTITFNGLSAVVASWTDTQIVATVPTGATSGPLVVHVNSVGSQGKQFEVPYPVITAINPPEAPASGTITITGSGFGPGQWYSPDGISVIYVGFVNFNGVQVGATSWSDTSITTTVPSNATSGNITISKYDATSNGFPFSIEGAPTVASLSPDNGPVTSTVTITGSGFGPTQSTSSVQFNGVQAFVNSWSDTSITAVVPSGAATGPVSVSVAGVSGPTSDFKLTNSVQLTDSLGYITTYHFEQLGGQWNYSRTSGTGCTTCVVQGALDKSTATHNDSADVTTTTDELTHTTTYTWDSDHNLLSQSTPLDANNTVTTSYTYNSFGEPLTVTDPLGNVTTNTYDGNGNLVSVTSPAPNGLTAASVTQFGYDTKGQLTTITDPLGHVTTLAYYPTGLIYTTTDQQQNVTTYEYDPRGNRTRVIDALGTPTVFAYDLANRLTRITYVDQTHVDFGYDSRGRRTTVTDQNGHISTYAYDDADRLTSVTDPAQNVTQYAYDTENNLLSITDANLHTTSFLHDAERRVVQTAFPSGLVESYVYDVLGNLTSKTDRKNQTILYVYDALNRLTHKGYPDSTGVDYVYDLASKIKQVTDPTGTYGLAYDNMGRLIGTSTSYAFLPGNTYTNSYTYDAASNRTGFTAPDGSTNTYAYDSLGRLSTLMNSLTGQYGFSYDNLGRRTQLARPNGVNTNYGYDSLSRLLSVLHQNGTNTLDGAGYSYDNAGNRTSKTNYINNITENYTYDPLYRLTQVTQGATTTESYSYDAVGNRLSSLGMSPYVYNSSNELTSMPSGTFTYDANGNPLSKTNASGTTQYAWDFENRLTSAVVPGVGTVTFRYDPFGRRVQKSGPNGTVNYVYDGVNAIEELDSSGTLLARYTQSSGIDEPLSALRSGTTAFYQADGLGSITSLSSLTGTISNSYTYDTFGNATVGGTFVNPYRYTARDFDSEMNLQYSRARYYDPSTGRFVSEDPLQFGSGDVNFYAYVDNGPTDEIDPLGLCPPNKDCRLTVSCGPKPATHGYSHCTLTVQNGDTFTAYDGEPADEHVFWGTLIVVSNKVKGRGGYNFIDEQVPCDCAQKEADAINAAHAVYSAFFQNSNTAAAMMTQACGIFTPFRSMDIWGWGPADPITGPWGTSNMRQLPKDQVPRVK